MPVVPPFPLTGPDIESGREAVEAMMDDQFLIIRNPAGERDGVFDPVTRKIAKSPRLLVYGPSSVGNGMYGNRALLGRGKLSSLRDSQPRVITEFDQVLDSRFYKFAIPIDGPAMAIGDTVYCLWARRSFHLPAQVFEVRELKVGSFAVSNSAVVTPYMGADGRRPAFPTPPTGADPVPFQIFKADAPLIAGRAVRMTGAFTINYYDSTDPAQYGEMVGIVTENASTGQQVAVCDGGKMILPGWGLSPGTPYFANGTQGQLSTVPPLGGVLQMVGVASPDSDAMNVLLGQPVLL